MNGQRRQNSVIVLEPRRQDAAETVDSGQAATTDTVDSGQAATAETANFTAFRGMQRSPRAGGGGRVRSRSRRRAEPVRRTRSSPQQLHDQLQRAVLGQEAVDTLSLLQRGADPNLRVTAPHIRTPRSLPSSRKEKTIKFLNPSKGPRFRHDNSWSIRDPEAGADNYAFWHTEHRDKGARMETLLHRAARDGKAELVRALLDHGADASERDWAQRTPLHVAAAADTPGEVLQLLLSAPGTLIDAQDAAGDTALHCALRQKNRRNTILLLEAGARADIRNKGGRTALKHLLKDFPQALETAFDRSLRLVRPLGWSGRAIQFDYSLFNPCLLDDDESSYVSCMETRLLNSIEVEATRDQLFLHPLCQSFLNLKWKMISPLYVIDIIIFFVFVVSFNVFLFAVVDKRRAENITDSALISNDMGFFNTSDVVPPDRRGTAGIDFNVTYFNMPLESITFFIVAFTCVYIDLRETIKMWVLGVMPYLRGPENVITWFCTSTAIACLCTDVLTFEQLRQVAAACLLASWTELLFMFGRAEFASMHVMLFVTLIRTLSVFMMVYTAITFAFTSSFFVLFCDKPDEFDGRFDTMTSAFFTTVVMSIGELNYDPTQLHGSKGGYAIYLLFIFFMLIITMNAMVGMAVNDTRDMAAKAEIKLHKKYIEFAHLFERHQRYRRRSCLWRILPSVNITLLGMLPEGRLAASWHVLPGPQLGWRHRWRVMFPGKEGGYAAQRTKGTEQLRQWLAQWPGLLRQAARIVIIKHHDSWDQPVEPGSEDFQETETDGPRRADKDAGKDSTDSAESSGISSDKDIAPAGANRVSLRPEDAEPESGGEEGEKDEGEDEDEGDGGGAPDQLVELRHAVLDLKCQLGKMQDQLAHIGRVVSKIAYTQQSTVIHT